MNVVVVLAHPSAGSLNHAAFDTAVTSLTMAGHHVTALDLYAIEYPALMSFDDRHAYHGDTPIINEMTLQHASAVKAADTLVFIYPTWWSSLPAILKGWLEKVMAPGIAFVFDEATGKVKPGLKNVRRIIGISTYASPLLAVKAANDNGRRTLLRALRLCTGVRTRSKWIGLYSVPASTHEQRTAFLSKIDAAMAAL